MAKYKRKHKKNRILLSGIAVIAVLLIISTGYSLWSDTLYIKGTANIKFKEQKLDTITVNKTSNQYLEFEDDTWGTKAFSVNNTQISNTDDKIEVIGNYTKRSYNVSARSVTFTLDITNNYSTTMTNGKITLLENSTRYTITPTITETVVNGKSGTIVVSIRLSGWSSLSSGTIKYKISYDVDGTERYLYLTINIT